MFMCLAMAMPRSTCWAALKLVWAEGVTRAEGRRAIAIVEDQQAMLLAKWETIHGGVD